MSDTKFQVHGTTLTVTSPIVLGGAMREEDMLLEYIMTITAAHGRTVTIDLRGAGSLPSTVLALCILAARKAEEAEKTLVIRAHSRNAKSIALTGLNRLATIELE